MPENCKGRDDHCLRGSAAAATAAGKDADGSSWVPTTPVKPSLTTPKPICPIGEETEAVLTNWSASRTVAQGNQDGNGERTEMERLLEDFYAQNAAAARCESTNAVNASIGLDCRVAAIATKSDNNGANAAIYNELSLDAADKWNNVSFADLLALVSQIEGNHFQNFPAGHLLEDHAAKRGRLSNLSTNGSTILCRPSFDLNSPPRTMSDAASRESLESQFAPITPDQGTRANKEQVFKVLNMSVPETTAQEKVLTAWDVELNEVLQKYGQSELLLDQSEVQDHAPDKGGSQGSDLNETQQQRPRKRKHRPKVVIEGQAKRTPKPRTPKPAAPEGTVPKRKYVRRNGGSKVTETTTENGTDKTAPNVKPPGSEGRPVGKRKYVRRKGVNNPAATPLDDEISRNDEMIGQRARSSCRRSLNFDIESQGRNDSSGMSSNFDIEKSGQNLSAQDNRCLKRQLQHAMESRIGETELGEGYGHTCSKNQVFGKYLSPPLDKSTGRDQNECTTGKCQILFSDSSHDKEVNVEQLMLKKDAECLRKNPSSSNCSTSARFAQEVEARVSKRQNPYTTEAEFCSRNSTGANYNSFQSYFPKLSSDELNGDKSPRSHYPVIHKKRMTEKGHKSATLCADSTVTAMESCSIHKASPLNGGREEQFDSAIIHEISDYPYHSRALKRSAAFPYSAVDEQPSFNCLLTLGDNWRLTRKRSKGPTRVPASLCDSCEKLLAPSGEATTSGIVQGEVIDQSHRRKEDLFGEIHATVSTKKRSKRTSSISSLSYVCCQHQSLKKARPLAITWNDISPIDEMIKSFSLLDINAQSSQIDYQENNALITHQMKYLEQNALVVHQRDGTIVPFKVLFEHKRKPRPKVDLDDETSRVWNLLLEDINSEGIDGTDEEKTKWWEEERRVFHGRADSFIARMHLVQGDRRFSPWKGSVVDSVIGVFLTQNVSDHLSSSAFMSLAAQYPLKLNIQQKEYHEEQKDAADDMSAWHEDMANQTTSGQGSLMQHYMDHNGEKEAGNSYAVPGSCSCDIKSTHNTLVHLTASSQDNLKVHHDPDVDESVAEINETLSSSVGDKTELDDIRSSQNSSTNSVDSVVVPSEKSELSSSIEEETTETNANQFSGSTSFVELLQMAGTNLPKIPNQNSENGSFGINGSSPSEDDVCISEKKDCSDHSETYPCNITPRNYSVLHVIHNSGAQKGSRYSVKELRATRNKGLTAEYTNHITVERSTTATFAVQKSISENETSSENNCTERTLSTLEDAEVNVESQSQQQEDNNKMHQPLGHQYVTMSNSEVGERNIFAENPGDPKGKPVQLKACGDLLDNRYEADSASTSKEKSGTGKQKQAVDWDKLRKEVETIGKKGERIADTMDILDWEAVRSADVKEIAETIKARGMNNKLAERIKDFLDRLVRDHGSIDLEWLRHVPPDKAKEYLLSVRGLGLKSVECVRLLTLYHLAFPVDTNVGRIAVRLGWVPLQPLPESLQLHLLELYPVLESIQKYLWPRLCKLDQKTLYELHYQMITFGKVFCTKSKPNCNACPMRGECRHFASAFASARFALPAPEGKNIVSAAENQGFDQNSAGSCSSSNLCLLQAKQQNTLGTCSSSKLCLPHAHEQFEAYSESNSSNPIIEVPATPEPTVEEPPSPEPNLAQVPDIEEFEDPDEIPLIQLNMEEFTQNLQMFVGKNMELQEHEMSKALIALTAEAASIPQPKLKNINRLRTEHHVYELPDSHPLLQGFDRREPDDPCPYLLAIWTPGETANSVQPPERRCSSQESGGLCDDETCFMCNSVREANAQTVRGTLLVPCRTAMRGSFPLNGTYFQVNEVFADHASSLEPIAVPRSWIWNLPRRTVFFGTSVPTIFKGLSTEEIQYCFWRGFVCVRGFEQTTRAPKPLMARLHFPASKMTKEKEGSRRSKIDIIPDDKNMTDETKRLE